MTTQEHSAFERIWKAGFDRKVYQLKPFELDKYRHLERRGDGPYISRDGQPFWFKWSDRYAFPKQMWH